MTVSTTQATSFTVDELVLHAYQLAGLVSIDQGTGDPSWPQKSSFGRRQLAMTLTSLQTDGVFARFTVFHSVAIVADDADYLLPAWVLDVLGDAAFAPDDDEDSEHIVTRISQAQWQVLTARAAESSQPSLYYAHRGTTGQQIDLRLWPTPTEDGTLRLQVQRYNADTFEGSTTVDLEPFWHEYITSALAYKLAVSQSLPASRLMILKGDLKEARDKARGKANEGTQTQVEVDHPTGWSNR